jgi:hydrogenase maturation protease
MTRTLVAGVGNIFLGDDGFGVEAARRMADRNLPEGVSVADFGIRGVHLAYELLNDYDVLVLIDAVARGEPPGTISIIEPHVDPASEVAPGEGTLAAMDAHGMHPEAVLAMVEDMGGHLDRVLIVGCEPAEIEERIGLSEPVEAAIDRAVEAVEELVGDVSLLVRKE